MTKRKTSKEIIESEKFHDSEHAYIKFPGKELIRVSKPEMFLAQDRAEIDYEKVRENYQKNPRRYGIVHTHIHDSYIPESPNRKLDPKAIPSPDDLKPFLGDFRAKYMAIAQQDSRTGKVGGYFVFKKTKQTPKTVFTISESKEETKKRRLNESQGKGFFRTFYDAARDIFAIKRIEASTKKYQSQMQRALHEDSPDKVYQAMDSLAETYHLRYRFVPAKDSEFDKTKARFVKKGKLETLLKFSTASIAVITFLISLLFSSANLTGKVIWNFDNVNSNATSFVFFIFGIIFLFAFLKTTGKR